MIHKHKPIQAFKELVAMKYQVYNGLFLGLPFEGLADTGVRLPIFANDCRSKLKEGKSPQQIVEQFFKDSPNKKTQEQKIRTLFQFLQLIERQVVLFDALEDAAFHAINDVDGFGSLANLLSRIKEQQKTKTLAKKLADYKIRIVLTAHPTQFYPDSILGILTDLNEAIAKDQIPVINDLLLQMGKTRFQNRQRPTPVEEAHSLIWYLEHIFYLTLPNIQERLIAALPIEQRNPFEQGPKVEMGFWPGGDRDGNPYVTSETTLSVAHKLKSSVLTLYIQDIEKLLGRLTFDGVIQPLQIIRDRLTATLLPVGEKTVRKTTLAYSGSEELIEDLKPLRQALINNHQSLFINKLDDFIYKVQIFGFHFALLDLRQDSRIHTKAIEEIFSKLAQINKGPKNGFSGALGMGRYAGLTSEGKISFLEQCLVAPNMKVDLNAQSMELLKLDPLTQDTLESFAAMQSIQKSNGAKSLARYVISQTNSELNLLEVMVLARLAGWKAKQLDFDIVPLFETIEDLDHAEEIMRRLFSLPGYIDHLQRRGKTQTIMLGFSDGTKDGGYITANWAIHKAKRNLTRVSREAGVTAIFFDGRGGPPSRGGGNTHKFYRSLGADIEHNEIQLTVQGQTISSNFGTPEAARYNVEQLFTAGLEDKIFPPDAPDLTEKDIQLLDRLSLQSKEAYAKFRKDPLFLPYLEEMTPLRFYNMLNIASRPTRRGATSLRFEDLRAIPFVGAWSQMKQNIPGFYGVGTSLNNMVKKGEKENLELLYGSSLFFRTLLENTMMSLSKSYFPLTRYLEKDKKYGRFWKRIYKEATDSKQLLKDITGQSTLLENNLMTRESIHLREKIILPLLVIQQFALTMVKNLNKNPNSSESKANSEFYTKMVVKSMAANINAARNSA